MTAKFSDEPDALGYFYAFLDGDPRQLNVRLEEITNHGFKAPAWIGYVGGEKVVAALSKSEAERDTVAWAKAHPA